MPRPERDWEGDAAVNETIQALLLIAALLGVYALMFKGFFGGTRTRTSHANPDGPAWGSALMGGFAASTILEQVPGAPSGAILAIAALVGFASALPSEGVNATLFSLPQALVGGYATVVVCVGLMAPRNGVVPMPDAALALVMLALYGLVAVARLLDLRMLMRRWHKRMPTVGSLAIGFFAAADMITFLLAPGGLRTVDTFTAGAPAALVWTAVIVAPFILGALHVAFLHMFNAGVALATLYLAFAGVAGLSFLVSIELVSTALVAYAVTRWVIRGFSGASLTE